jgi:GxxExxY protein
MTNLIMAEESGKILGACYAVYANMGHGFLESVYQECLELEFAVRSIPFRPQVQMSLSYNGTVLRQRFQPDFLCDNRILLELKATSTIAQEHEAQVVNYLRATGLNLGLLVNFGHHPALQVKRFVI